MIVSDYLYITLFLLLMYLVVSIIVTLAYKVDTKRILKSIVIVMFGAAITVGLMLICNEVHKINTDLGSFATILSTIFTVIVILIGIIYCISNTHKKAIIATIMMLIAFTSIGLGILVYTDSYEIVGYAGGKSYTELKSIKNSSERGKYIVTLSDNKGYITADEIVYGGEYRVITDCIVTKKGIFNEKKEKCNLLIMIPPDVDKDYVQDMSESEKQHYFKYR